jgi:hypothetical protein
MGYRVWAAGSTLGRRTAAAVDAALGLPRYHRPDEPGVHLARDRGGAPLPYTETACLLYEHADGRAALEVTPEVTRVHGETADVRLADGTTSRTTITATVTHAALPGRADEWTALPPRGGLPRQRDPDGDEPTRDSETRDAGGR